MALMKVDDQKEGSTNYGNTGVKKNSGYDTNKKTTTTSQKKATTPTVTGIDLGDISSSVPFTPQTTAASNNNSDLDIYSLYSNYLAQQRAAAEASYRRNVEAINNAYGQARNYYDSNLASTRNVLKNSYDSSKKDIDTDAEASLREAYINNMINRKNLQQALTAQGLNGGASETTQASMLNNYGNARNEIETQQAKNLADLLRTYNDNLSSAQNAWSSQMASLELQKMQQLQQAENALNSMQTASLGNISTDSSYLTALSQLMKAQSAFEAAPTVNSLLQDQISVDQANAQALADTAYWRDQQQKALLENATANPAATVVSNPRNIIRQAFAI